MRLALVACLMLGACSSATPGTVGSTGQGSKGANAASIDTCALLTPAEIQGALGVAMKPGARTTTDTSSDCEWESQDESASVGVGVQDYDDALWRGLSGSSLATQVGGLGEAAFKGVPHQGDISIRQGGYEIDIGIVDFALDRAKLDAAALALAKLVLSRL